MINIVVIITFLLIISIAAIVIACLAYKRENYEEAHGDAEDEAHNKRLKFVKTCSEASDYQTCGDDYDCTTCIKGGGIFCLNDNSCDDAVGGCPAADGQVASHCVGPSCQYDNCDQVPQFWNCGSKSSHAGAKPGCFGCPGPLSTSRCGRYEASDAQSCFWGENGAPASSGTPRPNCDDNSDCPVISAPSPFPYSPPAPLKTQCFAGLNMCWGSQPCCGGQSDCGGNVLPTYPLCPCPWPGGNGPALNPTLNPQGLAPAGTPLAKKYPMNDFLGINEFFIKTIDPLISSGALGLLPQVIEFSSKKKCMPPGEVVGFQTPAVVPCNPYIMNVCVQPHTLFFDQTSGGANPNLLLSNSTTILGGFTGNTPTYFRAYVQCTWTASNVTIHADVDGPDGTTSKQCPTAPSGVVPVAPPIEGPSSGLSGPLPEYAWLPYNSVKICEPNSPCVQEGNCHEANCFLPCPHCPSTGPTAWPSANIHPNQPGPGGRPLTSACGYCDCFGWANPNKICYNGGGAPGDKSPAEPCGDCDTPKDESIEIGWVGGKYPPGATNCPSGNCGVWAKAGVQGVLSISIDFNSTPKCKGSIWSGTMQATVTDIQLTVEKLVFTSAGCTTSACEAATILGGATINDMISKIALEKLNDPTNNAELRTEMETGFSEGGIFQKMIAEINPMLPCVELTLN